MNTCKLCGKLISTPSYVRKNYTTCAACSQRGCKRSRLARWEAGERPRCKIHPKKTVNRAWWVTSGKRKCRACIGRIPAHARRRKKDQRRIGDPLKHATRKVSREWVRRGILSRKPCEVCGAPAEMHHPDYSQPFTVRWLCDKHHKETHRAIDAIVAPIYWPVILQCLWASEAGRVTL